ncbi:hypothetical protein C7M71_007425 [Peterkaempfera bronchialis]|uniref:Uncharacterized protein n=1 Tax=Peterkaempfera bronchialis TaxID=2126346 RepID=A0A345SU93_9ACTN|nr:hypothetical protein C7M71_007425 [Peterkaempfera bronchialis]
MLLKDLRVLGGHIGGTEITRALEEIHARTFEAHVPVVGYPAPLPQNPQPGDKGGRLPPAGVRHGR